MADDNVTIQDRVKHEEGLINRRLTWMLVFQGFMFNAAANASKAEETTRLTKLVPWVGFFSAFLTFLGVITAYQSIDKSRVPMHMLLIETWAAWAYRDFSDGQTLAVFPFYCAFPGCIKLRGVVVLIYLTIC